MNLEDDVCKGLQAAIRGNETDVIAKGHHDPCVGIRTVSIGEAMAALVIADHYLQHREQMGEI